MEKTPRRSLPSGASVVVDPASQVPAHSPGSRPPRSHDRGSSTGARRKAETTLVLQARRVDTLRRQVLQRQRAQVQGRRRQVVLWAVAGAGAVLLGGWLATRLSPPSSDRLEAPLVLGRSEEEPEPPALEPPAAVEGDGAQADPNAESPPRSGAGYRAGAPRTGVPSAAPSADPAAGAAAPAPAQPRAARSPDNRSPDDPKVVGDWGDGFDKASSNRAVNLDDLPTE